MTITKNLKRSTVMACLTAFCALGVAGQAEARHHHKESKGRQAAGIIHAVADTIRAVTGQGYVVPAAPVVVAPAVVTAPGVPHRHYGGDGSKTTIYPNGVITTTGTGYSAPVPHRHYGGDGSKTTIYPNGVITTTGIGYSAPVPHRHYGGDGSKTTIYPNGVIKTNFHGR